MSFSNYTAQALLNYMFGKTSAFDTQPDIYVGLSTTEPTEAGGNVTEPSSGGYARVAAPAADWGSATNADPSVIANADVVDFGTASGTWSSGSNMTHFVFFDASSGGNVLGSGALTVPKPVINGDPVTFEIGALSLSLD
jgi:hypothetical protein